MEPEKETKSRTKIKKEMEGLQKIGESLVDLPQDLLERIGLPLELQEAVLFAQTLKKRGARHRQMQYIGTLMRKIDAEPVKKAVEDLKKGLKKEARKFHQLEEWRDGMVDGNDDLAEDILNRFPIADRQRLFQIVRNARKEKREGKKSKASRALFQYLRELAREGKG